MDLAKTKQDFGQEVKNLIDQGVWTRVADWNQDWQEKFETSHPSDGLGGPLYALHPTHLVGQPQKESHKIRITLDLKSSPISSFFQA